MIIMKRFFVLICAVILLSQTAFATDYDSMYEAAQPFSTKLYNDIDPFDDEDNIKYAYSPYPLFRTSANLYFKDYNIEPGYSTLTPRKLKGEDYVLFKQGGKVQYIIPIVKKEPTPINFYDANIPKVKQTKMQKFTGTVRKKFYEISKDSMKMEPPKSLLNVDVDVKYIIVTLYYGEDKYTLLFRRTPY